MQQRFAIKNGSINCDHSHGNYTKTQVSLACDYRKIYYTVSIKRCSNFFVKYHPVQTVLVGSIQYLSVSRNPV